MRLHVHEWGDRAARPLVCVHGVTAHGRRFRRLAEERLARHFHVLAPDLRGHGRSSWEPPWKLETHVEDLIETIGDCDFPRATWIGHSFGGRLVLELAARYPAAVERAVLLDPAVQLAPHVGLNLAEEERKDKSFATREEAVAARLASGRSEQTPREALEEEMSEHLEPSRDGRLRYRYCPSAVIAAYGELCLAPPLVPAAAPLSILLVLGAKSYLVLDEQVDALRDQVAERLEVVTVAGGHDVLWDAFADTADALDTFLEDLRAQRARDELDGELPGRVLHVEDGVDLDDLE